MTITARPTAAMSRNLQTGALSFALTCLYGAGLWLLVGGRPGQQLSPPVGLAVAGLFCAAVSGLLLTLACIPGLAECLRPVARVAAVGITLDTAALAWSQVSPNVAVVDVLNGLQDSSFLLLPSMVALLASSVLFVTRWWSSHASRTRFEPLGTLQLTFRLFRRHHRLLGWLALACAGAHSVYFLLRPGADFEQWTGIAATGLLSLAGVIGLITSYKTFIRLWAHRIVATLLVAALALHWSPFISSATVLLLGLCAAGLLHLKLMVILTRASRQASILAR
jgi:hypothetical protein